MCKRAHLLVPSLESLDQNLAPFAATKAGATPPHPLAGSEVASSKQALQGGDESPGALTPNVGSFLLNSPLAGDDDSGTAHSPSHPACTAAGPEPDVEPDLAWEIGAHYTLINRRLYFTAHPDDAYTLAMIRHSRKLFYFSNDLPERYTSF